MRRLLRILQVYVKNAFLQWLAWRSFAFTLVANQAVTPLIGLAVWSTALPGNNTLPLYYFVLLIVRLMTVSYENHTFSGKIYSGELAEELLRPHSIILQPIGDNLSIRIWHIIIGTPVLVIVPLIFPMTDIRASLIVAALPALFLAACLQFVFTFSLALTAFWTERAHAVVSLGGTLVFLLGGVAVPVGLMPEMLQSVVEFLPFRLMMALPAEIITSSTTSMDIINSYLLQLFWLLVFAMTSLLLWKKGVRRYTVVGG